MQISRARLFGAALFLTALAPQAGFSATAPKAGDDPVVATVNGAEIRRSKVEALKGTIPQLANVPLEAVFDRLLAHMIDTQLVNAEAKRLNLQNDPQVKKRLAEIETQVMQEMLINRRISEKVTEDGVKARYQDFLKSNPGKEEVRARHILVKEEGEAKAIIKELKSGGDFAAIAKTKSLDQGSADGGDLGYFRQDDMVQEFAQAAFNMKPGQTSETPVHTQFGWHVIKVEDRRMGRPPSYEEVREQIRGQMAEEALGGVMESLRKGAKVARFKIDGSPAEEGEAPKKADPKKK